MKLFKIFTAFLVLLVGTCISDGAIITGNGTSGQVPDIACFQRNETNGRVIAISSRGTVLKVSADGVVIPGLEKMSRGVDITKLDLFPTDFKQSNGFLKPVLEFTYEKENEWINPSNDEKYQQPDQVSGVNTISAGRLNAKSEVSGDTQEYKNSLNVKLGLEVDTVKFGAYSASAGYKDVQEKVFKSDQSVSETSATVSAIQVDFRAARHLKLNEDFQDYLEEDLVRSYEDIPDVYDAFIERYGTHYFESGFLGGYLAMKATIENEYMMQSDDKEVNAQLEASFFEVVKVKGEIDAEKKKVSDSFRSFAQTDLYYYGGIPVEVKPNDTSFMEVWTPTVIKDPWLFGGRLKPLQELIKNETVKAEVTKAILVKRLKASLKEVRDSANFGGFQLTQFEREDLDEVESKLKSKKKKDFTDLIAKLDKVFDQVQLVKDKQLLLQAYRRVFDWPNNLLGFAYCFSELDRCVNDLKKQELKAKVDNVVSLMWALKGFADGTTRDWDHREARKWLDRSARMVHHYRNTVIDPCSNAECERCVKDVVQTRFYPDAPSCKDPILRKVIKH